MNENRQCKHAASGCDYPAGECIGLCGKTLLGVLSGKCKVFVSNELLAEKGTNCVNAVLFQNPGATIDIFEGLYHAD